MALEDNELLIELPPPISERFDVLSLIGSGGMGVVYRARDKRLGRMVALKVVRREKATEERFVNRFKREVLSHGAVSHRNIVDIFDYDCVDEIMFFSMELINGSSLYELIYDDALTVNKIIEVFVGASAGLEAVHDAGLLHRDIKPANIMVATDGTAKLMDFGLAKFTSRQDLTALTKTNDVLGTIPFMAPEVFQELEHDSLSDIYQLGLSLYEALAGQRAYEARAVGKFINGGFPEVKAPSSINDELDEKLDYIVFKAMAFDRNRRYQNAADLRCDLLAWLEGRFAINEEEPSITTPSGAEREVRKVSFAVPLVFTLVILLLAYAVVWKHFSVARQELSDLELAALSLHQGRAFPHSNTFKSFLGKLALHKGKMEPNEGQRLLAKLPINSPLKLLVKAHSFSSENKRYGNMTICLQEQRSKLLAQKNGVSSDNLLLESHLLAHIADACLCSPSLCNRCEDLIRSSMSFLNHLSIEVRSEWQASYHRSLLCFLRAQSLLLKQDEQSIKSLEDMACGLLWRCNVKHISKALKDDLVERLRILRGEALKKRREGFLNELAAAEKLLFGKDNVVHWDECEKYALELKTRAVLGFRRESGKANIVTSVFRRQSKTKVYGFRRDHRRAYWQLAALCQRLDAPAEIRSQYVLLAVDIMASPRRDRLADLYVKGKWGSGLAPLELAALAMHQCEFLYLIDRGEEEGAFLQAVTRWLDRVVEYCPGGIPLTDNLVRLIGEGEPESLFIQGRMEENKGNLAEARLFLKKGFEVMRKRYIANKGYMRVTDWKLFYFVTDKLWHIDFSFPDRLSQDKDYLWVQKLFPYDSKVDWQRSLWFIGFYYEVAFKVKAAISMGGSKKALSIVAPYAKRLRDVVSNPNFSDRRRQKCRLLLVGRLP